MAKRGQQPRSQKNFLGVTDEVALVLSAALLAAWASCLLWLSLASHLPAVPRFLAWDKLQHFIAYALLMFFSGSFFRRLCQNHRRGWSIGFLFTLAFGFLMEIAQETLSTSRHADWQDFLANGLGAGVILLVALGKKRQRG